nr:EOG090X0G3O [Eurycercus lamellatus]
MVFYFTSTAVQPSCTLFMGEEKHENEELIKWGWPEDVWFHVDKLSSAHVYVRLNKGQVIDDIPAAILEDAAQLVKANSIQGNKMNNIDVVYTLWSNLKKTPGMEVGQVRKMRVEKRVNEIINRLNKTKVEKKPDFRFEREQRDREEREDKKRLLKEQKEREREEEKRKQEEAELRSYDRLLKTTNMKTNKDDDGNDSDDFM